MPGSPVRYGQTDPSEPTVHELPPLRYEGETVIVRIVVRRAEDTSWRARLLFGAETPDAAPTTAEIFYAETEKDLWVCVYDLREHHLRDLYRSVAQ